MCGPYSRRCYLLTERPQDSELATRSDPQLSGEILRALEPGFDHAAAARRETVERPPCLGRVCTHPSPAARAETRLEHEALRLDPLDVLQRLLGMSQYLRLDDLDRALELRWHQALPLGNPQRERLIVYLQHDLGRCGRELETFGLCELCRLVGRQPRYERSPILEKGERGSIRVPLELPGERARGGEGNADTGRVATEERAPPRGRLANLREGVRAAPAVTLFRAKVREEDGRAAHPAVCARRLGRAWRTYSIIASLKPAPLRALTLKARPFARAASSGKGTDAS